MPKTTFPAEGARKAVTIYYNAIESLSWFLNTAITEDENGDVTNAQKSIPGHQRRKGPSDQVPINVSQSTAVYMVDPSLKSGNARPGTEFTLATTSLADTEEKRQFTYTGRFIDLHAVLMADIKYNTYLYVANGGRHTLAPDGGNEG
tara:strand:+ start:597 stop:1037 length:441 start_codon:yes stop_codon:yes gene_type:complete